MTIRTLARLVALALFILTSSAFRECPAPRSDATPSFVLAPATAPTPTPTPQPYEEPGDCRCRIVNGKRVCTSACE